MSEKEHNGWTNFETWGVALILGNEPATEERCSEIVLEVCDAVRGGEMYPVLRIEDAIKDYTEDLCGLCSEIFPEPSMMARQLLIGSLGRVNWREIAEHYADDYDDGAIAAHRAGQHYPV